MPAKAPAPVYVLGVGMTKFLKPRGKVDYPEMGYEAGIKAMLDAHINYDDVEQGFACYVYGDSACGQRVFYQFGMTGIPIYNVNNNCGSGATGLAMGRNAVAYGQADCVLVVGFEKMMPGSLPTVWKDRASPLGRSAEMVKKTKGSIEGSFALRMFGYAGVEYIENYGASPQDFAEIARINHQHSKHNPYAQFQDEYSLEQILESPKMGGHLTKLQCCPTSDGAAAAVLVSQAFLDQRPELKSQAILIAGQGSATDSPDLFAGSLESAAGSSITKAAVKTALDQAGLKSVHEIKVCELHDCFAPAEMLALESLGFAEKGKAFEYVRRGDITYGGKTVVNPSGGLLSKGHPLGATGLAQCAELVWQLRGWANNRLVEGARAALSHNVGMGGFGVVTVYKRADGKPATVVDSADVARLSGVGYNPAVEARGFTEAQASLVRSKTSRCDWAIDESQKKVESHF